jgi:hypothetical protein
MPGAKRRPDHAQADPGELAARSNTVISMGLLLALRVSPKNRKNAEAQRSALMPRALVLPNG